MVEMALVLFLLSLTPTLAHTRTGTVLACADAGWVSSGITVAAGDVVTLQARGQAITGPLRDFPLARSTLAGQSWNNPCGFSSQPGSAPWMGPSMGSWLARLALPEPPLQSGTPPASPPMLPAS
jgi:hypothetical protein